MLFLQPLAVAASDVPPPIPIADATGLAFERALLATDDAARQRELVEALAADRNAALWGLRLAETRLGRTINRVEEAAEWLSGCLVAELAAALTSDRAASHTDNIGWRLPLLAEKLLECERRIGDFERKLEHEKFESLKELAYGASHEINNPLANIAARAQTLLEDEADSERQRKLVAIHRQAMRAHEMISDLMLFARPPKLKLATCELRTVVENVVRELCERAEEYGIELTCECATESIVLRADETQLGVAIGAIIKNALEAVGEGGHVQVAVRCVTLGSAHLAEVAVFDDGPGISESVRRHMFDPFFSGREAGRGLGFGASKCWRIVTDHGGQVVVQHGGRSGAEITIQLPLANEAAKLGARQR
jgi:signal transduction histidine kinase